MAKGKKKEPEYTLNVFPHYDEQTKREVIVFLVQTMKIFVSFRYEILLEESVDDRLITIRILGLYVPEILLPQTGPARGRRDLTGLSGTYTVRVIKQDKSINDFQFDFTPQGIALRHKPKEMFILASTDPVEIQ